MVPESSSSITYQETLRNIGNGALSICLVGIALLLLVDDDGINNNTGGSHNDDSTSTPNTRTWSGKKSTNSSTILTIGIGIIIQYHVGVVILQLRHPFSNDAMPSWVAPLFHGFLVLWFVLEFVIECNKTIRQIKKENKNYNNNGITQHSGNNKNE